MTPVSDEWSRSATSAQNHPWEQTNYIAHSVYHIQWEACRLRRSYSWISHWPYIAPKHLAKCKALSAYCWCQCYICTRDYIHWTLDHWKGCHCRICHVSSFYVLMVEFTRIANSISLWIQLVSKAIFWWLFHDNVEMSYLP